VRAVRRVAGSPERPPPTRQGCEQAAGPAAGLSRAFVFEWKIEGFYYSRLESRACVGLFSFFDTACVGLGPKI